jgi:hypothetical protein
MAAVTTRRVARFALFSLAGLAAAAVAGMVAAAFVVSGGSGGGLATTPKVVAAAPAPGRPPSPPAGALVLAGEDGALAVALAVQRGRPLRLRATVLAATGGGDDGLDVSFRLPGHGPLRGEPCGSGCYAASAAVATPRSVTVRASGKSIRFALPATWSDGTGLLRRATRAFEGLRSVVYLERLASSPTARLVTLWRLEAPDRVAYAIRHGSQAVVIGGYRWDKARGGRWVRSTASPLDVPIPVWGTRITNAHVLERRGGTVVASWFNPDVPAWFTARFDARTALPRTLEMTAAAHFMHHRYLGFNRPLGIRPPG